MLNYSVAELRFLKKTVRNKQSADYIFIISAFINEPLARLELATYALRSPV